MDDVLRKCVMLFCRMANDGVVGDTLIKGFVFILKEIIGGDQLIHVYSNKVEITNNVKCNLFIILV